MSAANTIPDYNSKNWWPPSVGDSSDLPAFSGYSWRHVMLGDDDSDSGGGHLWDAVIARGEPDKTAFPRFWGASQIGEAAAKVLRWSAASQRLPSAIMLPVIGHHIAYVNVEGRKYLILVALGFDPYGHGIITVYPIRGHGVARLDKDANMISQPLEPDEE